MSEPDHRYFLFQHALEPNPTSATLRMQGDSKADFRLEKLILCWTKSDLNSKIVNRCYNRKKDLLQRMKGGTSLKRLE